VAIAVPADLPMATTDANQIETAILNLAVNARDAMAENGGTITISAEEATPPSELGLPAGRFLRLSVRDTGSGMDASTLERAAEPFFTTKGVGKGTGLGLSMVHGLAEQSGGRLALTSLPGEGTTVTLWLPVATSEDVAAEAAKGPAAAPAEQVGSRPLVIVAVDDDPL